MIYKLNQGFIERIEEQKTAKSDGSKDRESNDEGIRSKEELAFSKRVFLYSDLFFFMINDVFLITYEFLVFI